MAGDGERAPGRPQRFSDSEIELCLTLKVLFGLALRQVTGFVASLLKLALGPTSTMLISRALQASRRSRGGLDNHREVPNRTLSKVGFTRFSP